eukprot:521740_1
MGGVLVPAIIGYSDASVEFNRAMGILCIIITGSILIIHSYTVWKFPVARPKDTMQRRHSYMVDLTVFSVIITALIGNIMWCLVIWNPMNTDCSLIWVIALVVYCINRIALFEFAVVRLKVVFHSSTMLGFSTKFINTLLIGSVIDVIISFCVSWSALDVDTTTINDHNICFQNVYLIEVLIVGIIDMIWMLLLYYLFHRQMKKLFAMIGNMASGLNSEYHSQLAPIAYITRKLAVLLATSIVSTWSLVFFLLFSSVALSALSMDLVLNCICMVLCDKHYDKIYLFLCKCFARKDILIIHKVSVHNKDNADVHVVPTRTPVTPGNHTMKPSVATTSVDNTLPIPDLSSKKSEKESNESK